MRAFTGAGSAAVNLRLKRFPRLWQQTGGARARALPYPSSSISRGGGIHHQRQRLDERSHLLDGASSRRPSRPVSRQPFFKYGYRVWLLARICSTRMAPRAAVSACGRADARAYARRNRALGHEVSEHGWGRVTQGTLLGRHAPGRGAYHLDARPGAEKTDRSGDDHKPALFLIKRRFA